MEANTGPVAKHHSSFNEEEEEYDPLDAFMASVEAEVRSEIHPQVTSKCEHPASMIYFT